MSHHSSWFLYKTTVLSFAFLLFLATTALAAQREIIVMEMDVPAYASLEEAQKGKTDATLEAFPLMMAGEQYAYIVLDFPMPDVNKLLRRFCLSISMGSRGLTTSADMMLAILC